MTDKPIICYVGDKPYHSSCPHETLAARLKPGDCISGRRRSIKHLDGTEPYAGIVDITSFYDGPAVKLRDGSWVFPSCGDTIARTTEGET